MSQNLDATAINQIHALISAQGVNEIISKIGADAVALPENFPPVSLYSMPFGSSGSVILHGQDLDSYSLQSAQYEYHFTLFTSIDIFNYHFHIRQGRSRAGGRWQP
ncbi:hypothetical protein FG793_023575, partial [Salmonella enterica subsp. enterica serovar Derby]